MHLFLSCSGCITEQTDENLLIEYYVEVCDFNDDGLYRFTCPKGHENYIITRSPKYEILFMMGENAILDAYYREAIVNFTASLERLYEFFIEFVAYKRKISSDSFEECWKQMSKQSERQLGAYISSWLMETKSPPKLLSNYFQEFRNKVIHKGYIPNKNEGIKFGQVIIEVAEPIVKYTQNQKENLLGNYLSYKADKLRPKEPNIRVTQQSFSSGISKYINHAQPLQQHLKSVQKCRELKLKKSGWNYACLQH